MPTVFEVKEQAITDTPLLLIECTLRDGRVERWSTHEAQDEGHTYEPRVLMHNVFEMQTASDQGVDAIPRVVLTLANADSRFSQIERTVGWKGGNLRVRFGLFDLRTKQATTEVSTLFQGLTNAPDEITESTFRISAANRMNMQRTPLPQVRLQRRCPWDFPSNLQQRAEAVTGGVRGRYSRYFRCGYSPDVEGGTGNLDAAQPYTYCRYSRADCEARGMFRADASGRDTRRFGGCEFVPSSILVRSYGEKGSHQADVIGSEGRYNDAVPLVYGTAWYAPPVVFARNDGNLTHMEVLLGIGEIDGVVKVLVNDIEVGEGKPGVNMSGSGWFNLVSRGNRTGVFDATFLKPGGLAAGDPYGSMAYISVAVPNRINDGRTLPIVKVLLNGLRLPQYDAAGTYIGDTFTNNPAWVLLDILMRCGWSEQEVDLGTFANAAAFCGERIVAEDLFGNTVSIPRFQCNLALQKRRSAADVIRGIRNSARLLLTYGVDGRLCTRVENTIAEQQPEKPAWSNASEPINGGWPSYEFDESSILRKSNREPAIRLWTRAAADTPNRFSVEFQDELNEYQQDSLSLIDSDDIAALGQEVSSSLQALGIANFDQAGRLLKHNLDRSVQGNTYVEFETSVKAVGIQPGDLITLTYLKEGFQKELFRVLRISASNGYGRFRLVAQLHRDEWYLDTNGRSVSAAARRQPSAVLGVPRPLGGVQADSEGNTVFGITEALHERADGGAEAQLTIAFAVPRRPSIDGPGIPLLSLASQVESTGGSLPADQVLYYAVSALDSDGNESPLSFVVRATTPDSTDSNRVTLKDLRFSADTCSFHVYRGSSHDWLRRVASAQSVASEFVDSGLSVQPDLPTDQNFDHANFYWRFEVAPEMKATTHSSRTIGNATLSLNDDQWRGMAVRITGGRGKGLERIVTGNTGSLLTLDRDWTIELDATSTFTVSEPAWRIGATTQTSPVTFEIPNRAGAVVQICGRAANPADTEAPYELSTVTRWAVGGGNGYDEGPPPPPTFGIDLSPTAGGTIEIGGIGFTELTNTRTISAARLGIYYWPELSKATVTVLTAHVTPDDELLHLDESCGATPGTILQAGFELMRVEEVQEDGCSYRVTRAVQRSGSSSHDVGERIYVLERRIEVLPFPRDFFGSPASSAWKHTSVLPDVRIAAAEMIMINANGEGGPASVCLTGTEQLGLRTLSGRQITFQLEGFAAVEDGAAPEWYVDATHSVRDVFAFVGDAPSGSPLSMRLRQGDLALCELSIPAGATTSQVVSGVDTGPLWEGERLAIDILSVGSDAAGSDLTVVIRL